MGLFNRKQLAAIAETTPGTFNSSVRSATYAQFLPIDPAFDFDFQTYDRKIFRGSLTKAPPLSGEQRATATFSHELAGHSDGSSVPGWDLFLRACGFPRKTIYKITIGAVTSGPFRHGETITQATSLASAIVFFDTYDGTTTMYIHTIVGTPTTGLVWTGASSGATATESGSSAAAGFGWAPSDFPTQEVTYSTNPSPNISVGHIIRGSSTGAIGVVEKYGALQAVTYSTTPSPDVAVGDTFSGSVTGATGVVESVNTGTKVIQARLTNGDILFSTSDTLTRITPDTDTLGACTTVTNTKLVTVRIQNGTAFSTADTIARVSPDTDTMGACTAATWDDMPTLSLALYDDGVRKEIVGARGNVALSGRIGEVAFLKFNFTGGFYAFTDVVNLTTPATPYKTPPVLLGVSTLLGTEGSTPSYIPRFTAFELDIGNTLSYRESVAAASGILETMISDRNGRGSIDPETDLEASYPFLTNWKDNVIGSLKMTVGSSVGNKFIVQVPGLRATGPRAGDRNNIATYDYPFAITGGQQSNVSNAIGERNDILIAYITA